MKQIYIYDHTISELFHGTVFTFHCYSLLNIFSSSFLPDSHLSEKKKRRGCQVVGAALQGECLFPGKAIRGQVQMPSCSLGTAFLPSDCRKCCERAARLGPGALSAACNAG